MLSHTDDHPQGDLAIFGYRPAMKSEFYQNYFYTLATCLNKCIETLQFLEFFGDFFLKGNI